MQSSEVWGFHLQILFIRFIGVPSFGAAGAGTGGAGAAGGLAELGQAMPGGGQVHAVPWVPGTLINDGSTMDQRRMMDALKGTSSGTTVTSMTSPKVEKTSCMIPF